MTIAIFTPHLLAEAPSFDTQLDGTAQFTMLGLVVALAAYLRNVSATLRKEAFDLRKDRLASGSTPLRSLLGERLVATRLADARLRVPELLMVILGVMTLLRVVARQFWRPHSANEWSWPFFIWDALILVGLMGVGGLLTILHLIQWWRRKEDVKLFAAGAECHGDGLSYNPASMRIAGWSNPNPHLSWKLTIDQPGEYLVTVTCTSPISTTGGCQCQLFRDDGQTEALMFRLLPSDGVARKHRLPWKMRRAGRHELTFKCIGHPPVGQVFTELESIKLHFVNPLSSSDRRH